MKKALLLTVILALFSFTGFSQNNKFWAAHTGETGKIITDKAVKRLSFPKEFKLFDLSLAPLREELFKVADNSEKHSTVISLPNADGGMEEFEVTEASNFEPALQAQFPEIRAFSGKGITDRYATLKLSISPQGIQTMVFRTGKENEFIEAFSADHTVYAAFRSYRAAGALPWTCTTEDQTTYNDISARIEGSSFTASNTGELKTMRLAQSCNAEYSNYFGATSSANVALVLAAFNATLTRCNGCYEKDLALHLNLIANTTAVIYYDAATDPYTTMGNWNNQLQTTLTANIGEANYDIGHMFGASGGGGNAGCIGCVCNDGTKGRGITSPADGIPQGDNFDIDYVVHEVGHQLGGNHTFSYSSEGTGVNKEVGAGITIMGYAGITSYDPAPHSIAYYHESTIQQIQVNLASKTCPITTNITATNATPVVNPVSNYTIPITTPFALTGSATDANPGDALTYSWEQNDNTTTTGANSVASPTKATGPNWLSFDPTVSPVRICPQLSTILAGLSVTPRLPGGDAICNIEALSSVARTLNFRLTVRDNSPYSSTVPVKVGQTSFTDMVVTVSAAVGPFLISSQNSAVSYAGGSTQTVTWDVAGTTGAPTNTANVKISWSTDGGLTFPTVLAASTVNDGTETFTVPAIATTTGRIKVEAIGNIYFDINNASITVTATSTPTITLSSAAGTNNQTKCVNTAITPITYTTGGGVTGATVTGLPTGVTGSYAGGTFTISGTPTVTGTFNYTVTTSGGTGGPATATGTIIVNGASVITLTSAAGTNTQTVNINTAITNITYSTTNGVTGATVTGLPAGVTGTYSGGTNGTITISGTPTAAGVFNYTVSITGGCGTPTATGTITVNLVPSITLSSGNNTQSVCVNTAITTITYTTAGGVTNATVTGLPTGVTGSYSGGTNGTFTISGTPTVTGTFNYTVTTSGGGPAATATGTITVGTVSSITLTSGAGSNTPTVCINAPITNITYSTLGGVTGATVTGLPAGVTGAYSGGTNGTVTISGTPTASGPFSYTVTTSGGCSVVTATGTVTVNPVVTTTLTSAAGTNVQTKCINTAITTITYSTANGVTGATVTGLPAGVTGTYSGGTNGTVTISGTPTAAGTFNYTVTTSGGCSVATATGTITVSPNVTMTLSSAAGTNNQAACVNSAITNITYTTANGVTGATATGLPAGVTGTFAGTTFTISGTPTATGTFNYTVTTSGGCSVATATGTITVNPLATITLTSAAGTNAQTLCSGGAITNIRYTTGNGATGAPVTGLPAGVTGTYAGGVLTISGTPTVSGVFNYTVSTTGGCGVATATGTITATSGPAITTQPISTTSCSTTATFNVVASGAGLSYVWQVSTNGGVNWNAITPAQTSATLVLTGLTPAQSTWRYRVIITNGCGSVTSNEVTAQAGIPPVVVLTAVPSTNFNPSVPGGLFVTVSPTGNYVYQWKRNGVVIPGILGPSYTTAMGLLFDFGTYTVSATDATTGCTGTSNAITLTDIQNVRNTLFISPNPTRDFVRVSFYNSTLDPTAKMISLYDQKGAKVMTKNFTLTGRYADMDLDLSKLANGTYRVVLHNAAGKHIADANVVKY